MSRLPTCFAAAVAAALSCVACVSDPTGEPDKGPIEETLDQLTATLWPGTVRDDGTRYVRRINAFFDDHPSAYWFFGFASRLTTDVFFACEPDDARCPLDERGAIAWDRVVGRPVFARVPGEPDFSPFWLVWRVVVPPDYEPNGLKSVDGIARAARQGRVSVEQVIFDHGGAVGPQPAVIHCALVLDGTELEYNGEAVDPPGAPAVVVEPHFGWHRQHRITFYDFTPTDKVFAPDPHSLSRPLMPFSKIFVLFRDCGSGSDSPACANKTSFFGAVSERGVEKDLTGDGDKADANNVIIAFPGKDPPLPTDPPYSPLWQVNVVRIPIEHDPEVHLIDTSGNQNESDVRSVTRIREYVDQGLLEPPLVMSEEAINNQITGNEGQVFFNCPSQVPLEEGR